jgi:hypothetical protein
MSSTIRRIGQMTSPCGGTDVEPDGDRRHARPFEEMDRIEPHAWLAAVRSWDPDQSERHMLLTGVQVAILEASRHD